MIVPRAGLHVPSLLFSAVLLASNGATAQSTAVRGSTPGTEYRFELGIPWFRASNGIVLWSTTARLGMDAFGALATRWESQCGSLRVLCGLARFLEGVLVDLPLATSAQVFSHEAFGHAARAREFGVVPRVRLLAPLPYVFLVPGADPRTGNRVGTPERTPPWTRDERALLTLGGYQAQEALARNVIFTGFRAGILRHSEAMSYQFDWLHRAGTVLFRGGDFNTHLAHLNLRYGVPVEDELRATLVAGALSAAFDPLFWWTFYAVYYRFLVGGARTLPFPTALVGRAVRVALTSRLLFVPWGREHQLGFLFGTPQFSLDTTFHVGMGPGSGSFGVSLRALDVRPVRWLRLGAELALWAQPTLQIVSAGFSPTGPPPRETLFGMGGWLLAEVLTDQGFFGLRAGGKSAGLLVEEPYAATFELGCTAGFFWSAR